MDPLERHGLLVQAGRLDERAKEIKGRRDALRDELRLVCQARDRALEHHAIRAARIKSKQIKRERDALSEELRGICRDRDQLFERIGIRVTRIDTQDPQREDHSGHNHTPEHEKQAV